MMAATLFVTFTLLTVFNRHTSGEIISNKKPETLEEPFSAVEVMPIVIRKYEGDTITPRPWEWLSDINSEAEIMEGLERNLTETMKSIIAEDTCLVPTLRGLILTHCSLLDGEDNCPQSTYCDFRGFWGRAPASKCLSDFDCPISEKCCSDACSRRKVCQATQTNTNTPLLPITVNVNSNVYLSGDGKGVEKQLPLTKKENYPFNHSWETSNREPTPRNCYAVNYFSNNENSHEDGCPRSYPCDFEAYLRRLPKKECNFDSDCPKLYKCCCDACYRRCVKVKRKTEGSFEGLPSSLDANSEVGCGENVKSEQIDF